MQDQYGFGDGKADEFGIGCYECDEALGRKPLFPAPFTESCLAAWLRCVGDERAENVAGLGVHKRHDSESAARLDLKRRVLGMFDDIGLSHRVHLSEVAFQAGGFASHPSALHEFLQSKGLVYQNGQPIGAFMVDESWIERMRTYWQIVCPIDFLPPTIQPNWTETPGDVSGAVQAWQETFRRPSHL